MTLRDEPLGAGVVRLSERSVLLWQVGVLTGSSPERSPEEVINSAVITFVGRRFPATLVAGTGDTYVRTTVLATAEVEPIATTGRVLYDLAETMQVTVGNVHVLIGRVGIPDRDWTDEEMCLWRGEWPTVLLETEDWWIAAYDLRDAPARPKLTEPRGTGKNR